MKRLNTFFFASCLASAVCAQSLNVDGFVEMSGAGHVGDNNPFWLVSNKHGLSSLDNNAYLRAGLSASKTFERKWRIDSKLDVVGDIGMERNFFIQQAYFDVYYKWLGLSLGSKELSFPLLDSRLSSGSLVVSGNARPIPQVRLGAFDYVQIVPRFALKAELSFGWFTDGKFQDEFTSKANYYSKNVLYHHKSFYMRIGLPEGKWQWEMGYRLDNQFGGMKVDKASGKVYDVGCGWRRYWNALIPQPGGDDTTLGDQIQYEGNIVGSEFFKLTHNGANHSFSAYLENYFDDFSGMGKLNGMDGLWGLEYSNRVFKPVNKVVLEYYQSTNQSGPLHGLDFDDMALKTGGADDYYNNFFYTGWTHWGYTMGTPLAASPVYNKNGSLKLFYNRVKAVHLGVSGDIVEGLSYICKLTYSKTWGTPYIPTPDVLDSFSAAVDLSYTPRRLDGWMFNLSVGGDASDVYGDNFGAQFTVRKSFDIIKK